jgi:hypothetical protein
MAEQQQYAPPPPPPEYAQAQAPQIPTTSGEPDLMARLQQLAALHDSGALTDEEFTAAKTKLLTS